MEKRKPLEGVKVFDLSWVITGPQATKALANCGATVIRLESMKRLDIQRAYPPYAEGKPGVNRSGTFAVYHDAKYGVSINLRHPRGLNLAKRLVAWADVVVENMAPGVLDRLGLDYEEMKRINPKVIMARASLFGQTGPYARVAGFGMNLQAYSGFGGVLGHPDRGPMISTAPWTDFPSASMLTVTILAALDRLKRTGRGTYIDFSQHQASIAFLSPAVLNYRANKRVQGLEGNREALAAPHGVYPTREQDRWVALAVTSDRQWRAFLKAVGEPESLRDEKFATLKGRKEHEDELDNFLAGWTRRRTPEEVMGQMQEAGVPAGIVANGQDLHRDLQLQWRQHFWRINHREMGYFSYENQPFKFSNTPLEPTLPSPCLGEHTEEVCKKILGMSDEEYNDLSRDGVFE